jgi:hypothetical protein
MMPVMNTVFGLPEELPFDMGHLRHPIQYHIGPTANDKDRRTARLKLSGVLERKPRLQISATQPPPPVPQPFSRAEPQNGPARFRAAGEPIGRLPNQFPFASNAGNDITLADGPTIWLRLMPESNPGWTWPAHDLQEHAVHLAPFAHFEASCSIFSLRAGDGVGICLLSTPNETTSVAFAFETGEVFFEAIFAKCGMRRPDHLANQ